MAARIALILSQPSRGHASATELIENLVAAAMLVPGLDANLIGDLESFELGGTDHLCLQGHTRDVVLASFLDLHVAQLAWTRLGQTGQFVDFRSSGDGSRRPQSSSSSSSNAVGRRVFYYRLHAGESVSALLDQCGKLLAAQSLSLVSIRLSPVQSPNVSGNANSPAKSPAGNTARVARHLPTRDHTPSSLQDAAQRAALSLPRAGEGKGDGTAQSPTQVSSAPDDGESEDWSNLDRLVDDLDAMDL